MSMGAIGCSVGRNIFMHRSPEAITRALSRVIRERWTASKAMDALRSELGLNNPKFGCGRAVGAEPPAPPAPPGRPPEGEGEPPPEEMTPGLALQPQRKRAHAATEETHFIGASRPLWAATRSRAQR